MINIKTKKEIYLRNIISAWKLHKSNRWFNKRNIYSWILLYTINTIKN